MKWQVSWGTEIIYYLEYIVTFTTVFHMFFDSLLSGGETITSLAVESCRKALEMAKVEEKDVDLVLLCTSTPDDLFGSAPQVWSIALKENKKALET